MTSERLDLTCDVRGCDAPAEFGVEGIGRPTYLCEKHKPTEAGR